MIVGLGIDLVTISRIQRLLDRYGVAFTTKVFTPDERRYCDARPTPATHYAARFAAKEATLKALAVPPGLRWHELEVTGGGGPPRIDLSGRAARAAQARGVATLTLSLTHEVDVAAAVVVAEG